MSERIRALADAAVTALTARLDLAGQPAAPGPAELGALRWSARALTPGLAAIAAAAQRTGAASPGLREELGAIGRSTERAARQAGGAHRGALWVLGLLVAGTALDPGDPLASAKALAAHPDRKAPRRPSQGSTVTARYGAAGARGEARAGFPHVRRALDALHVARDSGTAEPEARLDALLTIMSTVQDTGLLYAAGPHGLRRVQAGARAVLEAGGASSPAGRAELEAFDIALREQGLVPRGSPALLAGALFLDAPRYVSPRLGVTHHDRIDPG
ncbi:triphosphoribosyl-dephospho-CoA synthase [Streptomyces longispororuber]|uniref:triphosphoribosyl-dephospho-CoA synthase n=1 Tax=Streptomyces longispororuber TaxID=68230 RepID=UPI00210C2976|nr:triphosphoribosyl-dephospho-CoA synthase [Streptomyces longispororuber]MCQ4206612.1 triphosphoribosyl-dephospho-CoA synthase [Streptomyces longispororuber]